MIHISVGMIKEIVKGELVTGLEDRLISDAERYIRRVDKPDMLTFIWENEKPDFNRIKKYSPCTIVTNQFFDEYKSIEDCSVILVKNVGEAFWTFVRYYRDSFNIPVITVTGTSGKTTTKDMISHILSRYLNVVLTIRSFNGNHRNFPNLLRIDHSTEASVFEIGVGEPGDLTYACKYFRPAIGIITNIGAYHLDTCRTVENYIKAKAEIVSGLDDNGILILNSDDENIKKINLKDFKGRIVYFGVKNKAHFQASNIKYGYNGMRFLITFQNVEYPVYVQGYGEHQVYNALAAMAAVHELGIGIREAARILTSYENLPHHLEMLNGINGSVVIDDTWNCNSTGLTAALKTLVKISRNKKKIVLIGELQKTGEHTEEIARELGKLIADLGIDMLITVGETVKLVANSVTEVEGHTEIMKFNNTFGIYDLLKEILDENTILLGKSNEEKPIRDLIRSLQEK